MFSKIMIVLHEKIFNIYNICFLTFVVSVFVAVSVIKMDNVKKDISKQAVVDVDAVTFPDGVTCEYNKTTKELVNKYDKETSMRIFNSVSKTIIQDISKK